MRMSKADGLSSDVSRSSVSPGVERTKSNRPKSTPANRYRVTYADNVSQQRPKTASLVSNDCERLGKVERESFRQHKFNPHLPVQKIKPVPWQAQLEGTQKPVHIAPGYILSRSKSKYQMIINDKFFEQQEAKSKQNKQSKCDPELEQMINTLKQQVADLNVYLEEERMNHRETQRKAEEFLQDKVEEMRRDHKESVRRITDEHEEQISTTLCNHKQEMLEQTKAHEHVLARYKTELQFLQGAFESYKSQSNAENHSALREMRAELEKKHELDLQAHLRDLGGKLTNEKNAALAASAREHNKQLSSVEKQCQKELETLNRRFSNHSADLRKLKEAEVRHQDITEKFNGLLQKNEATEKELANVKRENAANKARVTLFEKDFDEKVQGVDSRYKAQMADLMEQNTEVRKQYIKKCEQLYSVKSKAERDQFDQLQTSKDTMKALIQTRSNAFVSIAASNPQIKQFVPKERPCSAPATRQEEYKASMSAGETDHVLARREVPFVRPQSVLELSAVFDTKELDVLTEEELKDGLRH